MSKGLKSIFIVNAFPSFKHTDYHGKILNFLISLGKKKNT